MSFLYNSKSTTKARTLRKKQTDTERLLWSKLRGRQIAGCKFYRQYPIGMYVVDFYCPEKKIVIELDGSQHIQQANYDNMRSLFLEKRGVSVLRFWDNDVLRSLDCVLETIYQSLIA